MQRIIASLVLLLACCAASHAENWPAWRGPTGQGFCNEKNIPAEWSSKDKVKWKVPLKDAGNSTPVIWGDKIFLTQANKTGTVRSLLCFERTKGKLLWQKDVKFEGEEINWGGISYTNASAVTDGERVVASFASAGLYCFDFEGKELWNRTDLGTWQHEFGSGSSPVLYEDLCILWCGPDKKDKKNRNLLLAVDKKTGKTKWEHPEKEGSWGTPVIARVDKTDQLLLGMGPTLKGFDPKSGKELWHCKGLESYVYTSALYSNGIAVGMSGYHKAALAVKLGGSGDITKDRLWLHKQNLQRVGSGMIVGDHLYMVDETGPPKCYDLKTGGEVWKVEKRARTAVTWGSLVHAEGRLYCLLRNGDTLVMAAKPKYEQIAVNSLGAGENTNSSLAISNGDIFIRTFRHLWCIGEKK